MAAPYPEEVINTAKVMYIRRTPVKQIKETLNINSERVIYQWAKKGFWDEMLQHETVEEAACRRMIALVEKPEKTDADYKEIEKLSALLDRLAGVDLKKAKAKQIEFGKPASGAKTGSKRTSKRNDVSGVTAEQLDEIRNKLFFDYQKVWYDNRLEKTRFILKSRQIGATYYFAWEAFENAITTGDNQIFLSASRNQAMIFKAYIYKFALEHLELELKGTDVISLIKDGKPWADLRFVSTNGRTAQGYHGHFYVDEVFWIPDFEKLDNLASPMASQKKWRMTYFSTPSVKSHGAYKKWSGEKYNERRKNKVEFDLTHETLKNGHRGADKIWRNIVTVKDAEAGGCDLFDIEHLIDRYSEAEFNNLFMCAFMEAGISVFDFNKLLLCAVNSEQKWKDVKSSKANPYTGDVWIGYDPARKGDKSTVIVLAAPCPEYNKFRVLEKLQLHGTFEHQADNIKKLTEKYKVKFIGIDSTGQGLGVYERVKAFFRNTEAINYTLENKTRLVQKGIAVISNGEIEWDEENNEIPQAFLQIQQTTTSNDYITYVSNRKEETGHADVAWATLHALSNQPLVPRRKATVSMG